MRQNLLRIFTILLSFVTYAFLPESCPEQARRCAAIGVIAIGFWAFELLPLYITSLLIVVLLSFTDPTAYQVFFAPFSSPVLLLFFGGFMIAQALRRNGCDRYLISHFVAHSSPKPTRFLWWAMLSTALLSMWISNTAATIIMLGIMAPIFHQSQASKAFILAIPFSANIGGIGTPIGTPPNALAIGFLADYGISIHFAEWVAICFPLLLVLLFVAYLILRFFFPLSSLADIEWQETEKNLSRDGKLTLVIIGLTIILWLTAGFHGIPEGVTALLSVFTLLAFRLIDRSNLKSIEWDILILMWGALALGVGVERSGLGKWLVGTLFPSWEGVVLVALFASIALVLSLFISNTAAAALVIPIALEGAHSQPVLYGITLALMCSVAMAFPVSTPPNAIAYGTGRITNWEMIKVGGVITLVCSLVILSGFWWVIPKVID